ncbi:MAG: hypothetical protein VW475_08615, partial [Curvibacter sp.]
MSAMETVRRMPNEVTAPVNCAPTRRPIAISTATARKNRMAQRQPMAISTRFRKKIVQIAR